MAGLAPPAKPPAPTLAVRAKLGFSYLTAAQLKDLWRRTDEYALAEAFLKQCGAPPFVERRMRLAARDCIEARALDKVAAYFRRKVAEASKRTFICDTDEAKAIMKTVRARIDRDVEEVRSMCRSCIFC
jgi:hypothetical protein